MTRTGIEAHRIVRTHVVNVAVSEKTTWRHVLLKTDSGYVGVGEATLEGTDQGFSDALSRQASTLRGQAPNPATLSGLATAANDLQSRTILSAVDQAVHDLSAQILDQPLYTRLGAPSAGSIPLYANINRTSHDRSPHAFAANARKAASQGFEAIKIAPFDTLAPEMCSTLPGERHIAIGLERIRGVREAVPSCDLMIDCHWRFTPQATVNLLPALAEAGVVWLECPLLETPDAIPDLTDIRKAANSYGIRLCGLETAGMWADFAPFVEAGAYDVIMPDVKHAGGLGVILDIAQRAEALGTAVSLHNPSGPMAHLVSVHVMAAIGTSERLEIQWEESPLFFQITDPAPEIEKGACRPTTKAGLGAALMAEVVAQ